MFCCLPLLWAASAVCAESPSSFAYGIAIRAEGGEALYRLELPRAVYLGAVRPDLGDLRVFNGAGEVVPHAFRPRLAVETQKREPITLPFFPLYGEDAKQIDGLSLRVERSASGTIVQLDERVRASPSRKLLAYLVDATALKNPVRALQIEVKSGATYAVSVDVQASEDLSSWRTVASGAPLVSLQHDGARLEQGRVEFGPTKPKYFRISWRDLPPGAVLGALRAELGDERTVEMVRQWEAVAGSAVADKAGDYVFDTQGVFPADRVRFELPQANTVVQAQLFSRVRGDAPWRYVARGIVYRLRRDGTEISSPELSITGNPDRYWLLRVDQKGGGLGVGQAKLVLGWVSNEIVWVARGNPPFTLGYGSRDAKPSAYGIEALVPGYRSEADLNAKVASTGQEKAMSVTSAEAGAPSVLGGQRALEQRIDVKRWTLWASLVAGVAFLGWMAWRLVKQMGKASRPGARGPDSQL
jgi:Holliday junction resolvase